MLSKKTLAISGASIFFTVILFVWLQRPSFKVIKSWEQPDSINYNSFDPYFFNVVQDNVDLGHLPFSAPRNYFIYIGKESNEITYGHIKNYSFEYNQNIFEYLNRCTVRWNEDGVLFQEPSGHRLFIPKNSFIGGR